MPTNNDSLKLHWFHKTFFIIIGLFSITMVVVTIIAFFYQVSGNTGVEVATIQQIRTHANAKQIQE